MRVKIENKPFDAIIKQYDKAGALFYLDPPYHGTEDLYEAQFNGHEHLHDMLSQLQGKFVLSYNDDAFIRKLYSGFAIHEASRCSNLTNRYPSHKGEYKELIITNI